MRLWIEEMVGNQQYTGVKMSEPHRSLSVVEMSKVEVSILFRTLSVVEVSIERSAVAEGETLFTHDEVVGAYREKNPIKPRPPRRRVKYHQRHIVWCRCDIVVQT